LGKAVLKTTTQPSYLQYDRLNNLSTTH